MRHCFNVGLGSEPKGWVPAGCRSVPLTLLFPPFARIAHVGLTSTMFEPNADELTRVFPLAAELIHEASLVRALEVGITTVLNQLCKRLFDGCEFRNEAGCAHGTATAWCGEPLVLREDKSGAGSGGGDSLVQLAAALGGWHQKSGSSRPLMALGLEVVGARLGVYALGIDAGPVVAEPLSFCSLLHVPGDALHLRRLAYTLVECVLAFRALAASAADARSRPPAPAAMLPAVPYEAPRSVPIMRLCFRDGDSVVKYVRGIYGEEAHRAAAAAIPPIAPKLRAVEPMAGGWLRVRMDAVRGETPKEGEHEAVDNVRELVSRLHSLGFVHGDVRAANVVWDGVRAWLIDFDWAARVGEGSYPVPLNSALTWGPGAKVGAVITRDHDTFRVENFWQ